MKKNRIASKCAMLLTAVLIFCCGCGEPFPELTDEEYDQIVQFSTALVMRHSNNGVEKLATVTPRRIRQLDENPYAAAHTASIEESSPAASDQASSAQQQDVASTGKSKTDKSKTDKAKDPKPETDNSSAAESTSAPDETPADDNSAQAGASKEDETPSGDGAGEGSSESVWDNGGPDQEPENTEDQTGSEDGDDGSVSGENIQAGDQQEILNGLKISYTGYTVTSAYPDDSYAYALDADPGKKLLILGFRLSNLSGSDKELDMIRMNPHFQILVNGVNQGYTLVTVLDNDLSSFKGVIPADSKKQLILAVQVDSDTAKSIETLGMIASMGDDVQTLIFED